MKARLARSLPSRFSHFKSVLSLALDLALADSRCHFHAVNPRCVTPAVVQCVPSLPLSNAPTGTRLEGAGSLGLGRQLWVESDEGRRGTVERDKGERARVLVPLIVHACQMIFCSVIVLVCELSDA